MSATDRREKHYPALDGLRGLAVLMVMAAHFVRSYSAAGAFHTVAEQATSSMWTGVDLFFVLSGFLITGILLNARGSSTYFQSFYVRRVLRIFPLYYGVLLIGFVLLPLVHIQTSPATRADAVYFLTFTSNIRIALSGWTFHAFDVYWSLCVEEQFYLLWPLVLLLLPTKYHRPLVISLLVGCWISRYTAIHTGASAVFIFTMLPTRGDGLLIGALLAMSVHSNRIREVGKVASYSASIAIVLFFIIGSVGFRGITFYYGGWNTRETLLIYSFISGAYGLLLYLCIAGSLGRIFQSSFLMTAGRYSYCLYLIHESIAHLLNWVLQLWHIDPLLEPYPIAKDAIHLVLLFSISFGIAALSWRYVERPILALKKYFPYKAQQPAEIAAATA